MYYVGNVGTDDVVSIGVLQADHFSSMSRLVLLRILKSNESRYFNRPMGRPHVALNRDGNPEFD